MPRLGLRVLRDERVEFLAQRGEACDALFGVLKLCECPRQSGRGEGRSLVADLPRLSPLIHALQPLLRGTQQVSMGPSGRIESISTRRGSVTHWPPS